jgi:tetratricopeptide (TPR) repeat protein
MAAAVTEELTLITPEQRQAVFALYDQGLYLQAYQLGQSYAPLKDWRGTEARILAGRMAGNLGSGRLADWHFIHAYRQDPDHPDACWYFANYLAGRRGPLPAWQFLRRVGDLAGASLESRAHWLALHGTVLGRLRDFDAAEEWLGRAEALGYVHPWVVLERAALFALEDRSDEAEQMARKALEIRPWYRPAVQWVAHFLVEKERDQEALELLAEAGRRLESCAVWSQLAGLQLELKQYEATRASLEQFERLAPLMDKDMAQWLDARRSDVAYFLGEQDQALEYARKVKGNFYEQIVKRLENPPADGRRTVLPVGFVRQHHQTCAPATLASLCRFWDMPGEHLELAAAISYAGTPHHSERRWAEQNGWVVREFTVTWDSATSVLDRGLPFTLTTTEPTSSHLQACIGYDARRGTLLVRDPSLRHQSEFLADGLFERYRSTGPRGKVLVPAREAHRLGGLELPDSALYDRLYALESALQKHERGSAEEACRAMETAARDNPLTLQARRTLAYYDADPTKGLECVEKLLRHFPDDIHLLLSKASCLSQLSRREEYLTLLRQLAERTPTDPVCWQRYAAELAADAREHPRALYLLRRAIRCNPINAGNYYNLAHIRWSERRFDEATELYRFAFCLEDKDENLARSYFSAARCQGRTEEALLILRKRFERFGARSWHPARTLYGALAQLERLPEALAVLDQAVALRPDDGDLILFMAESCTQGGDFARGEELLQKAQGRSQPTVWLRTAASLASAQGDLARARDLWAEVLKVEPLAEDAHRAHARLLADTLGRPAALRHLQETCQRFEHNFVLHKLWMEWLRDDGAGAVEPVLRRLIDIHPTDAWARRELAWHLLELGRMEEAEQETEIAGHLEPTAVALHGLRGQLRARQGQTEQAKEAYRQAIRTSVDYDFAIHDLFNICETHTQRREALLFVHQELMRQVIFGEGLLAFRDTALLALEPEELLAILRNAIAARSDLWHAWAALVRQLVDMNQLDEAHAVARQAVERFPLLPVLWLDLAKVCRRRDDAEGEIAALNKALQLNPAWNVTLRELADTYERRGQFDQAEELLTRAIARAPLMAGNHADLAELLWRKGDRDKAFERICHAFELEPGSDLAWDRLCEWARRLGRSELAVDAARQLSQGRPAEARSWLRLAQAHARLPRSPDPQNEKQRQEECLAAFDQAIALNPRNPDFHDQKAMALAQAGRWDEAFAACRPAPWGQHPPLTLRGRAAWLEALQQRHDQAIDQMRAVLAEDPKYYWGWTQLADWSQATGRFDEYLEAAGHMRKLAPHAAQPLAYRGEARLRTGDRDGGLADLRAALKLSPDFALAGFVLFDEHLAAEEFDDAEKMLDHLQKNLEGDQVITREVQLRARQCKQDEAFAAFKRLCGSQEYATWPLDTACGALTRAGWMAEMKQAFRDAVRTGDWNPHVALLWAERFDVRADRDLDACLAALDQAYRRNPADYGPLDLKAELLAHGHQFDQALAVAREAAANPDFAIRARGRHAWIEKQHGRAEDAIDQMSQVVRDDPKYYWGWSQLAEWYEALGRHADHLRASERLVELAPKNSYAYSHRGAAYRNLGQRQKAKDDFATGLELSPGFEFVAFQLFDLQLQDGQWAACEKALQKMDRNVHAKEVAFRRILLAARRQQADRALEQIGALCDPEGGRGYLLAQAADACIEAGWASALATGLGSWLSKDEAAIGTAWLRAVVASAIASWLDKDEAAIGGAWVRAVDRLDPWRVQAAIRECVAQGDVSVHCLVGICDGLIAVKKTRLIDTVVDRCREQLRANTFGWGSIGRIYCQLHDDARAVAWLSDWADHADAESWMLINLTFSLRGLGRHEEVREIHQHALARARPDYTIAYHEVWMALDDALARKAEVVEDYFARSDQGALDDYHLLIATFARAVLVTVTAANKSYVFDEARQQLTHAARTLGAISHDSALRASYRRVVSKISQNCGTIAAKLWALWRGWFPLLPPAKPEG